jgi:hypothetical protein
VGGAGGTGQIGNLLIFFKLIGSLTNTRFKPDLCVHWAAQQESALQLPAPPFD